MRTSKSSFCVLPSYAGMVYPAVGMAGMTPVVGSKLVPLAALIEMDLTTVWESSGDRNNAGT